MSREERIRQIVAALPGLSNYHVVLIHQMVGVFRSERNFTKAVDSDLVAGTILDDFGDVLRIHHCFSKEPFSKDKFEYALEKVTQESGIPASLSMRGQRGFDITIRGDRFSLKTEAASKISTKSIHISKFMELGGGHWGDSPKDLEGLRQQFLTNLSAVQRILTLRALRKGTPDYCYELVEIPKPLLLKATHGRLEMKMDSSQYPKPGYCYVEEDGTPLFKLYFDGGGERKLQIKSLQKSLCTVHATWTFASPTGDQRPAT
jgi:Type II site-specific deoxyribonuclease